MAEMTVTASAGTENTNRKGILHGHGLYRHQDPHRSRSRMHRDPDMVTTSEDSASSVLGEMYSLLRTANTASSEPFHLGRLAHLFDENS